jgi:hypothetical protein
MPFYYIRNPPTKPVVVVIAVAVDLEAMIMNACSRYTQIQLVRVEGWFCLEPYLLVQLGGLLIPIQLSVIVTYNPVIPSSTQPTAADIHTNLLQARHVTFARHTSARERRRVQLFPNSNRRLQQRPPRVVVETRQQMGAGVGRGRRIPF